MIELNIKDFFNNVNTAYILAIIVAVINMIIYTIRIIELKKKNRIIQETESEVDKKSNDFTLLSIIFSEVPKAVKYIENIMPNGNGEYKFSYVLEYMKNVLLQNNITIDENVLKDTINSCVAFMNSKKGE